MFYNTGTIRHLINPEWLHYPRGRTPQDPSGRRHDGSQGISLCAKRQHLHLSGIDSSFSSSQPVTVLLNYALKQLLLSHSSAVKLFASRYKHLLWRKRRCTCTTPTTVFCNLFSASNSCLAPTSTFRKRAQSTPCGMKTYLNQSMSVRASPLHVHAPSTAGSTNVRPSGRMRRAGKVYAVLGYLNSSSNAIRQTLKKTISQ